MTIIRIANVQAAFSSLDIRSEARQTPPGLLSVRLSFGGHRYMTKVDILQGTLDMLILKTLSNDPMHGFAIALRIRQITDEVIQIGEGSLYPALYRMELKGWIKAEWGVTENNRRAKYYKLTRTGRKQLDGELASYARLTDAIAKVLQTA
jgi:PadR family transcriptional regulator, regulatory protein PadR